MKVLVTAFGRMNPPTTAHQRLINQVLMYAHDCDHKIFISSTQDHLHNPLLVDDKIKFIRKLGKFIQTPNIISSPHVKNPLDIFKHYTGEYDKIVFFCGSDRFDEYEKLFNKYNGVYYQYQSIEVQKINRSPESTVSASNVRKAVRENNYEAFYKMAIGGGNQQMYELIQSAFIKRKESNDDGKYIL